MSEKEAETWGDKISSVVYWPSPSWVFGVLEVGRYSRSTVVYCDFFWNIGAFHKLLVLFSAVSVSGSLGDSQWP